MIFYVKHASTNEYKKKQQKTQKKKQQQQQPKKTHTQKPRKQNKVYFLIYLHKVLFCRFYKMVYLKYFF